MPPVKQTNRPTETIHITTHERTEAPTSPPPVHLLFTLDEVCRLTGLSSRTLNHWLQKKWIRSVCRGRKIVGGRLSQGISHCFSGWQTVGLAILAGALRQSKSTYTIVGRYPVIKAQEALAGRSDVELLDEQDMPPHVAENVAELIASDFLPECDTELPQDTLESIALVLCVLNSKWKEPRTRVVAVTSRVRGAQPKFVIPDEE